VFGPLCSSWRGLPLADAIVCRILRGIASSLFGFHRWDPLEMTLAAVSILLAFAGVRLGFPRPGGCTGASPQ
jgi:hypothetical protein